METHSLSFAARHEIDDAECAQRTLDDLEDLRLRLEERFEEAPGEVTLVVHPAAAWLAAAHPFLPAARWAAAPAGRRYLAGWAMASELHVLNDQYMDRRAAGEDSQRALRGTAERLYVQLVLAANNRQLPPPWGPRRFARYLRWAWLIEGAAQYYAGQVPHFRAAVIRRMRNLELAFDEPLPEIERLWRRHLREEVARSGSTRPRRVSRSPRRSATG